MQIRTPAEDQAISLRNMAIGMALLIGLTIWVSAVGKSFRAVYLGPGAGGFPDGILVRTNPELHAIVPRDQFVNLKAGCRYDFNYAPTFGKGARDYSYRLVRTVALVNCP